MRMSNEQIQVFADCGGAEMPIEEACLIAECTPEDFAGCPEAQAAYRMEQLRTKLKIRQAVVKLAKEGVPNMVKIYLEQYASQVLPEIEAEE